MPPDATQHRLDARILRETLPGEPGVYLFKDASGEVIYVGKAKSLHHRVLSYFRSDGAVPTKTALMMKRAASVEVMVTATEQEAFILESTFIKRYLPRYNIILRDDKRYPCLRLDLREDYPRLSIVRRIKKDGALYFGPFSSAQSVRSTQKLLEKIFKLRQCTTREFRKRTRACLNFQMGLCLGPCIHEIPPEAYHKIIQQVRLFLEGRDRVLVNRLRREMQLAARRLDFEKAATIRDQIRAIDRTVERQHVVSARMEDQDVIGIQQKDERHQVVVLHVRRGCLMGSANYLFRDRTARPSEVLEAFLKQYYVQGRFIPEIILVSERISELTDIARFLADLASRKVLVLQPQRGDRRRLMAMAVHNAENLLRMEQGPEGEALMEQVAAALRLAKPPRTIEGLDMSNLGENQGVGSIVSFVDGLPNPRGYRRYRIKDPEAKDDTARMAEMVKRRVESQDSLPDLFLIDGGKGHLHTVERVLNQCLSGSDGDGAGSREGANKDGPHLAAIAKPDPLRGEKTDKIFLAGRKNPLLLPAGHPVLLLLMRIRDEAHRWAVGYHRAVREKESLSSAVDGIPGIGPARKRLLFQRFHDIKGIRQATREQLQEVPGITDALAAAIQASLKGS